jgi:hypothetical protein
MGVLKLVFTTSVQAPFPSQPLAVGSSEVLSEPLAGGSGGFAISQRESSAREQVGSVSANHA